MGDTIHKKKKNWPHFDKFHLGSDAYAEGWDRIFGGKDGKKHETRRGRKVQATRGPVAKKGSKKSKSARRMDRSKKIWKEEIR